MPPTETRRPARPITQLAPLLTLAGAAAVLFFGPLLADWFLWSPAGAKPGLLDRFLRFEPDVAAAAVATAAAVIAAVLGIVITVVSIVVQLAATRYTPRIAELFFRDRTNLAVLGFFVVAAVDAVWVSFALGRDFVPHATIAMSLLLASASVLMMIPYFAWVFAFLDPGKVVALIERQALAGALRERPPTETVEDAQAKVLRAVEQLSDVAMNAIAQKDKLIAQGAVDALKELVVKYVEGKGRAERAWFEVGPRLLQNPDFVSMSPESVEDLAARRVWLEWKVLRQYQALYAEALPVMPDMNYLIAIDTRYVGDASLATGDRDVLALVVKFFNTFLRATINAEQVRTAYNVLNQYRQLAENVLARNGEAPPSPPGGPHPVTEMAGYMRYYGQIAQSQGLGFVAETVAYDLATLCERAFAVGAPCHDDLLRVLLTVDQRAETGEQEQVLRGVRKAQVKLATFYLVHGAEAHARAIAADMKDEVPARLRLIREELLAVRGRDFWEVIDRGSNFDYLDEARREKLAAFFDETGTFGPATAFAK